MKLKLLISLPVLLFATTLKAQEIKVDPISQKVIFKEIIKADSIPASELFIKSKEWISSYFNSAKAVIQIEDKEAGKIIGKAYNVIETSVFGYKAVQLHYTFAISIKNGKLKAEITDITYESPGYYQYSAEERITDEKINTGSKKDVQLNIDLKNQTILTVNKLIASLEQFVLTKSDW
ncbi:MAG: DUF4468 domain-containing protein [Bacteroidota bacterium]|nr:DUF4468 domain-containing protein [Bacteroidota bacterium]